MLLSGMEIRWCDGDKVVLSVMEVRPKKKKSLVPVGCQLRSWVGREFILFFPAAANDR